MTAAELDVMGVPELRLAARDMARARGEATTWTAYAKREQCITFLSSDVADAPVPVPAPIIKTETAASVVAGFQALIESALRSAGSVNEDEVRRIVRETAIDTAALRTLVLEVVKDSDVVPALSFTVNGVRCVGHKGISHPVAPTVAALLAAGIRTWIHGEAGTGKTTLARSLAESAGMTVFCQPPSLSRYDVLGYMDAHSRVVETPVSRFVRADGPKCLLLDEVDSWGVDAQLAANLLLANGHAELPDGTMAIVRDGSPSWIVATANTTGQGATSAYVGRKRMDRAFLDRFDAFPLMGLHDPTERKIALGVIAAAIDALPADKEKAESSIDTSLKVRKELKNLGVDVSWSPRKTYALVRLMLSGMDVKPALAVLLGATDKAQQVISSAVA